MGVCQWAEPHSPASKVNPICASGVQTWAILRGFWFEPCPEPLPCKFRAIPVFFMEAFRAAKQYSTQSYIRIHIEDTDSTFCLGFNSLILKLLWNKPENVAYFCQSSVILKYAWDTEAELSTSPLPRNLTGSFMQHNNQQQTKARRSLVGGGVFCLSGVRVARGEQTPRGLQCHLLFVCPRWAMPSSSDDPVMGGGELHSWIW